MNFALDPFAKLPDGRRFRFAILQNRGRAAVTGKTLHQGSFLIRGLESCQFQRMGHRELALIKRCLRGQNQICQRNAAFNISRTLGHLYGDGFDGVEVGFQLH